MKVVQQLLKEAIIDECANQMIDKAVESGLMLENIAAEVKKEMNTIAELYLEGYEIYMDEQEAFWENSLKYEAAERCIDYVVNRYEDIMEEVRETIEIGHAGWDMIQELTVAVGKKLVENSDVFIRTVTTGPKIPLRIRN